MVVAAAEGLGWSSREAAHERVVAGAAEGLQRRGSALVCSVCTVDSNGGGDLEFFPMRHTETRKSAAWALSNMIHPKAKLGLGLFEARAGIRVITM